MKKQRLPRKIKKQLTKTVICVDISIIPKDFTVDKWLYYAKQLGVLIYDSNRKQEQIKNPFPLIHLGDKKNLRSAFKIKNAIDINKPFNGEENS